MSTFSFLAMTLFAYLLGAVPFGLLIGFSRGIDIRHHGSNNIGATNAGRVLGRKWGYLCLTLDILKGFVPVFLASRVLTHAPHQPAVLGQWLVIAVSAVLGHTLPVYLGFKGGKGVATTVGVALGIYPYFTIAMTIALVVYAAVRFATGYVSAGSLAIAVVFPAAFAGYVAWSNFHFVQMWPLLAVAILLGALIIVRHKSNIRRLLRGEEQRLGVRRTDIAPPCQAGDSRLVD